MLSFQRTPTDQGRLAELEPIGVIDIGSNSIRLVVYEGAVRAPTPLFNEKVLCGLGKHVATTGRLDPDSVVRALSALGRFKAVARVLRVKTLVAVATAAVRDTEEGADFIARASEACGVTIQILSGEREAELAANGIHLGFHAPDGVAGDLGGGSLELIDISNGQLNHAMTLPLGGLRLADVTRGRLDRALTITDQEMERIAWAEAGRGRAFYAVGGTWRSLARLYMDNTDYPLRVMQGYAIPAREAIGFCEMVRKARRLTAIKGIEAVARPRREVLALGALVMERALRRLGSDQVIFSVFGIREGLLMSYLGVAERQRDPLISFCQDYARLRSRSAKHAEELCTWTDQLFQAPALVETPEEKRLRHAACLLSDISWRAHPDYRGLQSLNVIAHSGLIGIDHPGRLFLAMTVFFRHAGPDEDTMEAFAPALRALVSRKAQRRARIVAAAIRTAHMLSLGMPGIIDEMPITFEGGRLVLTVPRQHAAMDGERLRRRHETLAELMGFAAEVRLVR